MKKNILCMAFCSLALLPAMAQKPTTKPAVKPAAKPVASPLKNEVDSASYAIGVSVINFYKQQGITKLNAAMVSKAISDGLAGKKMLLDDNACNGAIMGYMNKVQASKATGNIKAGEDYLKENKKRQGVITTASGLQYEVLTKGTGPAPVIGDTVICNYKGTFIDGSVFDQTQGSPIEFSLTGVIAGWTEVLQLMPVGSKYKVWVPYQLGYGPSDYGPIKGGSMLIFEIELVGIKGK